MAWTCRDELGINVLSTNLPVMGDILEMPIVFIRKLCVLRLSSFLPHLGAVSTHTPRPVCLLKWTSIEPQSRFVARTVHFSPSTSLHSQVHEMMASPSTTSFHYSSNTTPIVVSFWPARKSASNHWLQVYSEDATKRDPLQTSSTLAVRFSIDSRDVVIIEEVKGDAKVGSCVRGILTLPFKDLEEPSFIYGKKTDNTITISLSLRRGTDLWKTHYSTEVHGKWKDGARHMLQTKQLGAQQAKTGFVEITLQKASNTPRSIRSHIIDAFRQCSVPRKPPASSLAKYESIPATSTPHSKTRIPEHAKPTSTRGYPASQATAEVNAERARQRSLLHEKAALTGKHSEEEEARLEAEKAQNTSSLKDLSATATSNLVGPFVVEASNFVPGTTAGDIEESLQILVADGKGPVEAISCRILSSKPTVIAEMVFEEYAMAEVVIKTFNGKEADGRILHVRHKGFGTGTAPALARKASSGPSASACEEGAVAALRGRVLQLQEQLEGAEQMYQQDVQALQNTITSLRDHVSREDTVRQNVPLTSPDALFVQTKEAENFVRELFDFPNRMRITGVTPIDKKGFKVDFCTPEIATDVLGPTKTLIMDDWNDWHQRPTIDFVHEKSATVDMKSESEMLEKLPRASTLPVQDLMREETLVDLSGLDFGENKVPGAFPMHHDMQVSPNTSISGPDDPNSFHTASFDNDVGGSLDMKDEIREMDQAIQTVANIQRDALRTGKAVTMEIRNPEEMSDWLTQRESKILVNCTDTKRRALAVLWL